MKNFSKRLKVLLFVSILLGGIFIRFYRFEQLMNFSQEQATALSLTADMIRTKKIALIATPYLSRVTQSNHYFFQAGTYLYPLVPLMLIFKSQPLPITIFFGLMNIFSGVALFFVAKKFFGYTAATITFFIFAFNFTLVDYSRMIWHVPMLIPIMVAICYFFLKEINKHNRLNSLWIGFLIGLGWGIHLSPTAIGALFLLYFVFQAIKNRHYDAPFLYILGGLIGILPLIIFDVRHDFFNLRIFWEFFLGLFGNSNKDSFFLTDYHLVHLLVPAALLLGWMLSKIKQEAFVIPVLLIYLVLNIPKYSLDSNTPPGMARDWNLQGIEKAAQIIATDANTSYEVASIFEGETRATTLRYFLAEIHHKPALGVLEYQSADVLYVTARTSQDPVNFDVWEINVMKPVKVERTWPIQSDIVLVKLVRI